MKKPAHTSSTQSWEDEYQAVLNNIKYVEYIGQVDVQIDYNGATTKFKSRQIIDGMYRADKNIPSIITFKEK